MKEEKMSKTQLQEQFQNDYLYHCAVLQLDKLLNSKLITTEEYHEMIRGIRREIKPYLYELYPL